MPIPQRWRNQVIALGFLAAGQVPAGFSCVRCRCHGSSGCRRRTESVVPGSSGRWKHSQTGAAPAAQSPGNEELGQGGVLDDCCFGGREIRMKRGEAVSMSWRDGFKSCCSYWMKSAQHLLCCAWETTFTAQSSCIRCCQLWKSADGGAGLGSLRDRKGWAAKLCDLQIDILPDMLSRWWVWAVLFSAGEKQSAAGGF